MQIKKRNAALELNNRKLIDTLNTFFGGLLEKNLVDAFLLPQELPSKSNVVQTLVTSSEMLQAANPLAPVMPLD